jgi:hypothetical protein
VTLGNRVFFRDVKLVLGFTVGACLYLQTLGLGGGAVATWEQKQETGSPPSILRNLNVTCSWRFRAGTHNLCFWSNLPPALHSAPCRGWPGPPREGHWKQWTNWGCKTYMNGNITRELCLKLTKMSRFPFYHFSSTKSESRRSEQILPGVCVGC